MAIEISEREGFVRYDTDGVSSTVYRKDDWIYKVTVRNSLTRLQSDYATLQKHFSDHGYAEKLAYSEFLACTDEQGHAFSCVRQRFLSDKLVRDIGREGLIEYLRSAPQEREFLKILVEYFIASTNSKSLYIDLVGCPTSQDLWNSINLIVTEDRGLVLIDVGLSPHEDTLAGQGLEFYESDNFKHHHLKMKEAERFLDELSS